MGGKRTEWCAFSAGEAPCQFESLSYFRSERFKQNGVSPCLIVLATRSLRDSKRSAEISGKRSTDGEMLATMYKSIPLHFPILRCNYDRNHFFILVIMISRKRCEPDIAMYLFLTRQTADEKSE